MTNPPVTPYPFRWFTSTPEGVKLSRTVGRPAAYCRRATSTMRCASGAIGLTRRLPVRFTGSGSAYGPTHPLALALDETYVEIGLTPLK